MPGWLQEKAREVSDVDLPSKFLTGKAAVESRQNNFSDIVVYLHFSTKDIQFHILISWDIDRSHHYKLYHSFQHAFAAWKWARCCFPSYTQTFFIVHGFIWAVNRSTWQCMRVG